MALLADHVDNLLTFSISFAGMEGLHLGAVKTHEFEISNLTASRFQGSMLWRMAQLELWPHPYRDAQR